MRFRRYDVLYDEKISKNISLENVAYAWNWLNLIRTVKDITVALARSDNASSLDVYPTYVYVGTYHTVVIHEIR